MPQFESCDPGIVRLPRRSFANEFRLASKINFNILTFACHCLFSIRETFAASFLRKFRQYGIVIHWARRYGCLLFTRRYKEYNSFNDISDCFGNKKTGRKCLFYRFLRDYLWISFSYIFLSNFNLHTNSNHAYLCHKNIQNITQKTNNTRTIANINNLFILLHIYCILREKEYNFFIKKSQKFTNINFSFKFL